MGDQPNVTAQPPDDSGLLMGKSLDRIRGLWVQAVELHSFGTVTDGKVSAPSGIPYGTLSVEVGVHGPAGDQLIRIAVPLSHREDFLAIHWVFKQRGLQDGDVVWVRYDPAGMLPKVRPCWAVELTNRDAPIWSKAANAAFRARGT